jgi:hypothetical protein
MKAQPGRRILPLLFLAVLLGATAFIGTASVLVWLFLTRLPFQPEAKLDEYSTKLAADNEGFRHRLQLRHIDEIPRSPSRYSVLWQGHSPNLPVRAERLAVIGLQRLDLPAELMALPFYHLRLALWLDENDRVQRVLLLSENQKETLAVTRLTPFLQELIGVQLRRNSILPVDLVDTDRWLQEGRLSWGHELLPVDGVAYFVDEDRLVPRPGMPGLLFFYWEADRDGRILSRGAILDS